MNDLEYRLAMNGIRAARVRDAAFDAELTQFLMEDLADEVKAIAQYKYHIEKASDPTVIKILTEILHDEEDHRKLLEGLLEGKDLSKEVD